jgi:hypothetical protein
MCITGGKIKYFNIIITYKFIDAHQRSEMAASSDGGRGRRGCALRSGVGSKDSGVAISWKARSHAGPRNTLNNAPSKTLFVSGQHDPPDISSVSRDTYPLYRRTASLSSTHPTVFVIALRECHSRLSLSDRHLCLFTCLLLLRFELTLAQCPYQTKNFSQSP